ncbi:hypothetical protein ACHAWU_000462 [Discostella pseudostelligera]|uniref:SUMO-activating enzyme subunit n=1 Tax=Discostella pseudostelligera TaxID=259834 RepID=A0ABD3LYK6_9STRA
MATMTAVGAPQPPPTSSCPPILRGIQAALGHDLLTEILSCRILLVGSGGIGCELLKNLALSGFRHVEVIDLDTIDVSNLNRQFLFRSQHVGMPKCVVASEAALKMVPPLNYLHNTLPQADTDASATQSENAGATYIPHHGNIFDNTKFNVPYIQKFALVLNALDNVAARRQVNRLCLAASIPLIEAGTAGYLGQVTVIDKSSNTECYECQTKPTQKVYPICTIRSTPSQPVHCIVWAKELYKLLFGPKVEESMLFEDEESLRAESESAAADEQEDGATTDNGNKTSTMNGEGGEKSTYMDLVLQVRTLLLQARSDQFETRLSSWSGLRLLGPKLLYALFGTEINKQIDMGRYKTADKVPSPITWEDMESATAEPFISPTQWGEYQPTDIWTKDDCSAEIIACLLDAVQTHDDPNFPLPEFDKDCDMAMRFVTAASNLRSYVFQIEPIQSVYSAKGIAGNIIPAIATTNAIVAGLQVLQCFHILKAQLAMQNASGGEEQQTRNLKEVCRYTYCLRDKTRKGYLLQPTTLPDPNPNCFVCRNATVSLALNTNLWTLEMLLSRIIKKELGFAAPTIMVGEDIVYEEGEDIDPAEYASNLVKTLVALPGGGMGHGSSLRIEDFTQDLEVEVIVTHKENFVVKEDEEGGGESKVDNREEIEKFEIGGKKHVVAAAAASASATIDDASKSGSNTDAATPANGTKSDDHSDDDDIEVIEEGGATKGDGYDSKEPAKPSNGGTNGSKSPMRKRSNEDRLENGVKKAKLDSTEVSEEVECVVLEE